MLIEIPSEMLEMLIITMFGVVFTWLMSTVLIFFVAGRDIMNNFKLFFFNRLRGGGWGLFRVMGEDLKERHYVRKIAGLTKINKGRYAGTSDVTFFLGANPLRQHKEGIVNAVDLLVRDSRKVKIEFKKDANIKCLNCKEDVKMTSTQIANVDVPVPGAVDSSDLVETAITLAQSTHPQSGLNPASIKWIMLGGALMIFGVACLTLVSQPQFVEALVSMSAMR